MEQVSIIRTHSYQDDLKAKLVQLVEPLGGFEAFVKRGDRVLLKPNFLCPSTVDSAATTHPALIITLAALLKDMGCEVAVGDSPGMGSARTVAQKLDLLDDLNFLGVRIVEFDIPAQNDLHRSSWSNLKYKNLRLAEALNNFDRIINLPKLKTHGLIGITLATKNLFGCVAGASKVQWHYSVGKDHMSFTRLLVEIALSVNATLHILDGIIGMDGNGPLNGRIRQCNILIAGTNPIALERVTVELIQKKAAQFPIFEVAQAIGVPGVDLTEIEVKGESLSSCYIEDFEIPPMFPYVQPFFGNHETLLQIVQSMIKTRLVFNNHRCTKCRRCERHCPAKAISLRKNKMYIDQEICIQCCCCQEFCPEGALRVKDPLLVRLGTRIFKSF